MCVNAFFPKPPDPTPLPPATPPPPTIAPVKPKIRPLLDPKKIAKVDYGSKVKRNEGQKQVTADSLKINVGGGAPPAADTGGLNVT
tara:strand:- start:72 stop:329 length:258 start_codon:yes stop_codon:yes gene_type:complete